MEILILTKQSDATARESVIWPSAYGSKEWL